MIVQQTPFLSSTPELAMRLGLKRNGKAYTGACPSCGYKTGFSLRHGRDKVLVYCHAGGCSYQEILNGLKQAGFRQAGRHPFEPIPAQDKNAASRLEMAKRLWSESFSVKGSPVERYLETRGIADAPPPSLRYLPDGFHSGYRQKHPVMLGLVSDKNGDFLALHRTFLRSDGSGKADIEPNKMILGTCRGGSVHLGKPETILAVTEGIETGLSIRQATGTPTWAALSTGGLTSLILPDSVREVVICADYDRPGLQAACKAAEKWTWEGRKVRIAKPFREGFDFNDVLVGRSR